MMLCETAHVLLKPNQLYKFNVAETCKFCKDMADAAMSKQVKEKQ